MSTIDCELCSDITWKNDASQQQKKERSWCHQHFEVILRDVLVVYHTHNGRLSTCSHNEMKKLIPLSQIKKSGHETFNSELIWWNSTQKLKHLTQRKRNQSSIRVEVEILDVADEHYNLRTTRKAAFLVKKTWIQVKGIKCLCRLTSLCEFTKQCRMTLHFLKA